MKRMRGSLGVGQRVGDRLDLDMVWPSFDRATDRSNISTLKKVKSATTSPVNPGLPQSVFSSQKNKQNTFANRKFYQRKYDGEKITDNRVPELTKSAR